ncbi:MAG: 4-hydroxy-tetrahydrodipicolinate reductase [Bacteroidales bacterium]|nr:4-hydroxy-tetrahydrodipicolinate reductase [Bacteroidales bacterium]MDD3430548.1 4-hydroxy-tetrahydrodipicolinate reductase [Bacteroidales bacterium]MDD4361466.1 4-hydroxy-tetrahydrodipicolinate reductase [Bacteroidales bacterium]MDD4429931.1 4-hydroxy-tetrahydrodipicolinate reductase [Bacteroidales bacterium]
MKIVLIGYGKMGHEIERIALERGHSIACAIDVNNPELFESDDFRTADLAIEFTSPSTALQNYRRCFAAGLPVVSGTTGWLEHMAEIRQACEQGQTFFYASNFSLGVNLFFVLNKMLAEKMNAFPQYEVKLKEIHHTQKVDSPSGTAVSLAEDILKNLDRKKTWVNYESNKTDELGIVSEREGSVPGYHEVCYESEVDSLKIIHDAKSRAGFALGAVMAAEFTLGKKGMLGMHDLLGF